MVSQAFVFEELEKLRSQSGDSYLEFLKEPSMRLGVYTLAAGAQDPQTPHQEDEVYYVVSGKGTLHVSGQEYPVQAGSIVFVAARAEHRFHSITETLHLLVFFAAGA